MEHQLHSDTISIDFLKTSIRGLVMLLQLPEMEHFDFFPIFEKVIRLFKFFSEELKKHKDPRDNQFIVQLLSNCLPKHEFLQTIQKF